MPPPQSQDKDKDQDQDRPLRILHVVRTPVGGIFRHILDLANGQVDRGHHVGIVADTLTGGERAKEALAQIGPRLKLGVHRFAMLREPSLADVWIWLRLRRLIRQLEPNVLHGHGAKTGAFIRVGIGSKAAIRVYTPQGTGCPSRSHHSGTAKTPDHSEH